MPNPRPHEIPQRGMNDMRLEDETGFPLPDTAIHAERTGTRVLDEPAGPDLYLPEPETPASPAWYFDRIFSRSRSPDGFIITRQTLSAAVANPDNPDGLRLIAFQATGGGFGQRKVWLHNNSAVNAYVWSFAKREVENNQNVYPLGPGADFDIETEAPIWIGNAGTTNSDILVARTFYRRPTLSLTRRMQHGKHGEGNGKSFR